MVTEKSIKNLEKRQKSHAEFQTFYTKDEISEIFQTLGHPKFDENGDVDKIKYKDHVDWYLGLFDDKDTSDKSNSVYKKWQRNKWKANVLLNWCIRISDVTFFIYALAVTNDKLGDFYDKKMKCYIFDSDENVYKFLNIKKEDIRKDRRALFPSSFGYRYNSRWDEVDYIALILFGPAVDHENTKTWRDNIEIYRSFPMHKGKYSREFQRTATPIELQNINKSEPVVKYYMHELFKTLEIVDYYAREMIDKMTTKTVDPFNVVYTVDHKYYNLNKKLTRLYNPEALSMEDEIIISDMLWNDYNALPLTLAETHLGKKIVNTNT